MNSDYIYNSVATKELNKFSYRPYPLNEEPYDKLKSLNYNKKWDKIFKPDDLNKPTMWITLRKTPNFYANLPWMPEGKALWDAIKDYNPVILTGCPKGGWSEADKRAWCARELGANIKVITCDTKDKPKFCNEGDILIDDRDVIKDEWIAKKGKYVHYAEGNLEHYIKLIKEYI